MRKSIKRFITVKSIPGATTKGMMHHAEYCLVHFTPDIVILHCGTNDIKKDISLQEILQNVIRNTVGGRGA